MNIDLTKVIYNYAESIEIDQVYTFGPEHLDVSVIDRLDDIKINGTIVRLDDDTFSMVLNVSGFMWFSDKTHEFSFELDEILTDNSEINEEYIKISSNSIDILPIIWQNIILEIPL